MSGVERTVTDGTGWVYHNEDAGEEYSPQHPIKSGEVPDATRIRRSTAQEDVLWVAFQGEFERAHALEKATPAQGLDAATIERCAQAIYEEDDPWSVAWPWPNLNPEAQGGPAMADRYRAIARVCLNTASTTTRGEDARLREALERIAEGDVPRPVGKRWRADEAPSKNDWCVHEVWMYEECGACIEVFARAALQGDAAHTSQERGQ